MNYIGSKTIETERLILRKTEESDLKILWLILCDKEVSKYYLTSKINYDWHKELPWQLAKLSHANDNDVFQWSIIKKDTSQCIGQISVQERRTEDSSITSKDIRGIGWFITPKEQKKGYAYEAATAILKYMFEEVEISAIQTGAAVENVNSWHLMEKLGFIRRTEKLHKTKYTLIDRPVECYSYGITKEEYNNLKRNS